MGKQKGLQVRYQTLSLAVSFDTSRTVRENQSFDEIEQKIEEEVKKAIKQSFGSFLSHVKVSMQRSEPWGGEMVRDDNGNLVRVTEQEQADLTSQWKKNRR